MRAIPSYRPRRRSARDDGDHSSGRRVRRLVNGATGGLVATAVMTAFRLPISRSLPPTNEFWTRYVSGGDDGHPLPALVLHLCYGTGAGVVAAVVMPGPSSDSDAEEEVRGVGFAVVYSLLLSVFGLRVVLGKVLGQELEPDERLVFHLGHVVYGITLGAWFGSRTGE